jgi:hypothetical protein
VLASLQGDVQFYRGVDADGSKELCVLDFEGDSAMKILPACVDKALLPPAWLVEEPSGKPNKQVCLSLFLSLSPLFSLSIYRYI